MAIFNSYVKLPEGIWLGVLTIYKWANDHLLMENPWVNYLVGGAITILKNMSQWGWDDIPYMKWKIKAMFQTTNQLYIHQSGGGCSDVPQIRQIIDSAHLGLVRQQVLSAVTEIATFAFDFLVNAMTISSLRAGLDIHHRSVQIHGDFIRYPWRKRRVSQGCSIWGSTVDHGPAVETIQKWLRTQKKTTGCLK